MRDIFVHYNLFLLFQKIAELTEILQARESKMVQMSKDSNDLMETNNILRKYVSVADVLYTWIRKNIM